MRCEALRCLDGATARLLVPSRLGTLEVALCDRCRRHAQTGPIRLAGTPRRKPGAVVAGLAR